MNPHENTTGNSYPLPPYHPEEKPAYDCPDCQDTGVLSFWHDLGPRGGLVSSEACVCVLVAES